MVPTISHTSSDLSSVNKIRDTGCLSHERSASDAVSPVLPKVDSDGLAVKRVVWPMTGAGIGEVPIMGRPPRDGVHQQSCWDR
jgi:hypothetical protein